MKEVVPYCPDCPKGPKTENHVGNCAQNPSVYYFVSSAQVTVFCCLLHSATLCNGRRRRFRRTLYNVVLLLLYVRLCTMHWLKGRIRRLDLFTDLKSSGHYLK